MTAPLDRLSYPEKITVYLTDRGKRFRSDAEIPSDMDVRRLKIGLLRLLRDLNIYTNEVDNLRLYYEGRELDDTDTLAKRQIWDGSTIEIKSSNRG